MKTGTNGCSFINQMILSAFLATSAVGLSVLHSNATAGSSNQNVNVNTTVPSKCKISGSISPISFGTYDAVNTNYTTSLESSGSFDIACTKGTTATITISNGNYYTTTRRAQGETFTSSYLNYELYTSASYSTIWNETVGGSMTYNSSNASMFTFTIYGYVPPGQDVEAQNYIDTVVITTSF